MRRWDAETEALLPLTDIEQAQRLAVAVRANEFDVHLGAYDFDSYPQWRQLTFGISPAVLARVAPVQGFLFSEALTESHEFVKHRAPPTSPLHVRPYLSLSRVSCLSASVSLRCFV